VAHNEHPRLLSPIEVGPLSLSHRVVMAPLTRLRGLAQAGAQVLVHYSSSEELRPCRPRTTPASPASDPS
jgi:hypothetical protein